MSLKSQVVNGLKWSILAKGISQIFSWVSTFLVIRWLTPEDYGVMAIAMVFFALISYFTTNGLTSVLVKETNDNPLLERQMFTFSLMINVTLSGALVAGSYWLADYYNSPDLIEVMLVMALINPVTSFSVVPVARLQKDMRFKEKSIVESVAAFLSVIVAFVLAYLDYGYWALVYSTTGMLVARSALFYLFVKNWPGLTLNCSNVKPALSYAWHIQIGTLIWFIYNKVDTIILGKLLGMEKLGVYNVASDIAAIPLSKGSAILNDVGFAAFTKVKHDLSLAKHYAKRSMLMLGLVMFPIFYGIAAISEPMVHVLLGEKWIEAAPIITILCLVFPFRMQSSILSNFANAMGDAKFNLHNIIATSVVLVISISIGAQYGLVGAAWGWVLGYTMAYLFVLVRFSGKYQFTTRQLTPFLPIWGISTFMLLLIKEINIAYHMSHMIMNMLIQIAVGGLVILPFIAAFYMNDIKSLLKR